MSVRRRVHARPVKTSRAVVELTSVRPTDRPIDKAAVSKIITAPASPNQALIQLPERSDPSSQEETVVTRLRRKMPDGPSGGPSAARQLPRPPNPLTPSRNP